LATTGEIGLDIAPYTQPMPNSPAPLIAVERGGVREATHVGHLASVDAAGRIHDRLGDPDVVANRGLALGELVPGRLPFLAGSNLVLWHLISFSRACPLRCDGIHRFTGATAITT